jgi:diguanylate cyclase (GGDEF)-like protein
LFFYYHFKNKIKTYLLNEYKSNLRLFDLSSQALKNISDTVFYTNIKTKKIEKYMFLASQGKVDQARMDIYIDLLHVYKYLEKLGIRQFHFHTADLKSLIRFSFPDVYGDDLSKIRYSLILEKRLKKPLYGFECGRSFNGFRNIYPIFYNKKYVGSCEMAFSAKPIIDLIFKEKRAFYTLLVRKDVVEDKVFRFLKYQVLENSKISDNLLWDKEILKYSLSKGIINKKFLSEIEKKIKIKKSEYIKYGSQYYVINFIPIKNFKKETAAYFMVLHKSPALKNMVKDFIIFLILVTALNIFVSILLYLYLKKVDQKIENLTNESLIDPLTQVLNRRGFIRKAKNLKSYSVIFADIDFFKKLNDTYGHDYGDKVLKEVAKILKNSIKDSDLLARWGGEEFIILLKGLDKQKAIEVAERLRNNVKNSPLKITMSFGVASSSEEEDFEHVINLADDRLYKAKRSGRDKVVGD